MATFRSDNNSVNLNSNFSTGRLLNENETTTKYNQFKRNVNLVKSHDYSNNTNNTYTPNQSVNLIQRHYNNNLNNLQQEYGFSGINSQIIADCDSESEKFLNLKTLYDERIKGLYQEVKLIAQKLENDELLQTMKNDPISKEFRSQRLCEVIDENLHMEKEQTITRLNEDLAESKTRIYLLEQVNNELSTRLKNLSDECDYKVNQYEQKMLEYQKSQEILENNFNNVQSSMQNLGNTYDNEMKKMVDDCNIRLMKQNNDLSKNKIEISSLHNQIKVTNFE